MVIKSNGKENHMGKHALRSYEWETTWYQTGIDNQKKNVIIYDAYFVGSINVRVGKANLNRLPLTARAWGFNCTCQIIRLVLVHRRERYRCLPTF